MTSDEIKCELSVDYDDLVEYLLVKYGPAQYDYFCTESCASKNKKVSRANEGLECHHIDENKYRKLSDTMVAQMRPFECQKAYRLVYCNIIEHLLLHLHIILEDKTDQHLGLNGFFYINARINDYYNGYEYKRESNKKLFEVIKNNYKQYVAVLLFAMFLVGKERPELAGYFTPESLSQGWSGKQVEKIYKKLSIDSPRS